MVEKYEKDGKIAVLISRGYGIGFSTVSDDKNIAIDKRIVELCIGCKQGSVTIKEVNKQIIDLGYEDIIDIIGKDLFKHISNLCIEWANKGEYFYIDENDGHEYIIRQKDMYRVD